MSNLEIKADTRPLMHYVELLKHFFNVPPEIVDTSFSFSDLFSESIRLDVNHSSTGAGELLVTFYPSDSFLDFFATIVARDIDFVGVKN